MHLRGHGASTRFLCPRSWPLVLLAATTSPPDDLLLAHFVRGNTTANLVHQSRARGLESYQKNTLRGGYRAPEITISSIRDG